MRREIIIGIISGAMGIGLAILTESFLSNLIIDLYRWTTAGNISFFGKDFQFFSDPAYFLSLGFSCMLFGLNNSSYKVVKIIKRGAISLGIFCLILIMYCALDGNLKIMTCTNCNGTMNIPYRDIHCGILLGMCALLSGIPSFIQLVRKDIKHLVVFNFAFIVIFHAISIRIPAFHYFGLIATFTLNAIFLSRVFKFWKALGLSALGIILFVFSKILVNELGGYSIIVDGQIQAPLAFQILFALIELVIGTVACSIIILVSQRLKMPLAQGLKEKILIEEIGNNSIQNH